MTADDINSEEIIRWLSEIVGNFNFLRPGKDQSLGRDLCHVVAWRIGERLADEEDANGAVYLSNDPDYAAEKVKYYGWPDPPPVNYRTGQMASHLSLLGRIKMTETDIEMKYGIERGPEGNNWSPRDSRRRSMIAGDDAVTDVQKAEWAHEQGRGFYEADPVMKERVIEEAGKALEEYLREVG